MAGDLRGVVWWWRSGGAESWCPTGWGRSSGRWSRCRPSVRRAAGTRFVADRAVGTAVVDVLRAGGAGRQLPAQVGVSPATAHRRLVAWTEAGAVAAAPGGAGSARCAGGDRRVRRGGGGGQHPRAKGGPLTGPNPVERGTPGAPLPVRTDAAGLPRAVAVSAAHTPDRLALIPLGAGRPGAPLGART